MCGIFGFIATNNQHRFSQQRLRKLAITTQSRGHHAWGMAWIDSAGKQHHYKQTGPIKAALDLLDMAEDAQLLIGHCRYATQGDYRNNLNNHPFPVDGGWLVHNGQIHNYPWLVNQHDLHPVTDCDSEVLPLLTEQATGTHVERLARAVEIVNADPLAVAALWRSPRQLCLIRDGHPLHVGHTTEGHYFASLTPGLPHPEPIRNRSGVVFTARGGCVSVRRFKLRSRQLF
jgi:glucosamine 6-phosphate synthetase-like amidotransferase/phosphosugar isomerase protein